MCFPTLNDVTPLDYCTQALKNLKGISMGCINICNVRSKIDDIKMLLNNSNLDVLCIVETFLDDEIDDSLLEVPDYNFHRSDHDA